MPENCRQLTRQSLLAPSQISSRPVRPVDFMRMTKFSLYLGGGVPQAHFEAGADVFEVEVTYSHCWQQWLQPQPLSPPACLYRHGAKEWYAYILNQQGPHIMGSERPQAT